VLELVEMAQSNPTCLPGIAQGCGERPVGVHSNRIAPSP